MDAAAAMNVTCKICGWVHVAVPRGWAESEVEKFNSFYDMAPSQVREHYTQRSDISAYEKCFRCGAHYSEMKPSKPEDCPTGVTLQPIIWEGI